MTPSHNRQVECMAGGPIGRASARSTFPQRGSGLRYLLFPIARADRTPAIWWDFSASYPAAGKSEPIRAISATPALGESPPAGAWGGALGGAPRPRKGRLLRPATMHCLRRYPRGNSLVNMRREKTVLIERGIGFPDSLLCDRLTAERIEFIWRRALSPEYNLGLAGCDMSMAVGSAAASSSSEKMPPKYLLRTADDRSPGDGHAATQPF